MSENVHLRILEDEPIGTISPRLYGHFAEHLGRCCYEGLWVGEGSHSIPHKGGFRTDILEALKALPTPLLRWPGGCYADHYHWRDGVGPREERPIRLGLSCGLQVEDDNGLGTNEFLTYCEAIGAEPYLAGNMGSGSVQELCDWVEYCNAAVPTALVKERHANGRSKPFGVKLWGVGNENWGCGGTYEPESYGLEYRRYATMLRHVDSSLELVACGHNEAWNRRLVKTLAHHAGLVDHFSIHKYWIEGGPGIAFSEDQYYRLLAEAQSTEDFIKQTREILDEIDPYQKIGIALDEWGVWHPEAREWGPDACGNCSGDYTQAATQRDAVAIAVGLETFHRQCKHLSLANLAQIVNVLHAPIQTDGPHMWLTPTYHVLKMHTPHLGAEALRTEIQCPANNPDGTPSVSGTASRKHGTFALTLTNRHLRFPATVTLPFEASSATLLAAPSADSQNSPAHPSAVELQALAIRQSGSEAIIELPPHSVATILSKGR